MSSDTSLAMRVDGLGKRYRLGETVGGFRDRALSEEVLSRLLRPRRRRRAVQDEMWALRNISFDVTPGERVGIIGRNGAGKSTLLKILSRITAPSEGRAETWGRLGALLEVGTGFHPELTGRENVFVSGAILGMKRREVERKLDEIIDFAGIERFMDTPIKRYSSGMQLRLAFAVAAHIEPEILLVDEVLAVGDAAFQRKCLGRISEISADGRTVVFVSHNMPAVVRMCERVIVLDAGGIVHDGTPQQAVRRYLEAGTGSIAERQWDAPAKAPGDGAVHLKSVRVRNNFGAVSERIETNQPFTIEVEYWQLSDAAGVRPVTVIQVLNQDGTTLFQTADESNTAWNDGPRRTGVVTAKCTLPGNLFAEGRCFVSVTLSTSEPYVRHAVEPEAVGFDVVEAALGTTVRGKARNDWPGVMRPWLDWDITVEPS